MDTQVTETPIENELKRQQLEKEHACKVHCFEFVADSKTDIAAIFIKEPDRFAKMQVMDLSISSLTQAGKLLVETCAIKEASDARFFDENQENDKLWLGAIMGAAELVTFSVNGLKKK